MAVIEKRKNANGTIVYRAKIRLKGHRPKSGTFERISDAKEWVQKEEADIKRGLKFDDHHARRHTLKELITEYEIFAEHAMGTYDFKQRKKQLAWWSDRLGAFYLADITVEKLNTYKRELMIKSVRNQANGPRIAPATINHYLIALSAALKYAKDELNWIHHNPMADIKKMVLNNGRLRFLDKAEREALLDACRSKDRHPLLYPIVLLALSTGMRKGEVLNLCWKDIDFSKRVLRVEDSKNGDKRSVPLTGLALQVLQELGKVRMLKSNLVFARSDGVAPLVFRKHWAAALEAAEISNFRFHDLRHTAATYLLEAGATLPELSAILGHRTIQMVKRYAHLADNHAIEVMDRMTSRMFG